MLSGKTENEPDVKSCDSKKKSIIQVDSIKRSPSNNNLPLDDLTYAEKLVFFQNETEDLAKLAAASKAQEIASRGRQISKHVTDTAGPINQRLKREAFWVESEILPNIHRPKLAQEPNVDETGWQASRFWSAIDDLITETRKEKLKLHEAEQRRKALQALEKERIIKEKAKEAEIARKKKSAELEKLKIEAELKSNELKSNELKSNELTSNEPKSNEPKSEHVGELSKDTNEESQISSTEAAQKDITCRGKAAIVSENRDHPISSKNLDNIPQDTFPEEVKTACKFLKTLKEMYFDTMTKNKNHRQKCTFIRRKINSKLGQLTHSKSQILKVYYTLEPLLRETSSEYIVIYIWSLNYLAKAVVKQAETEVIVSPQISYPIAALCTMIMQKHPLFREFLIFRMMKNCIWTSGDIDINQKANEDKTQYLLRMGFKLLPVGDSGEKRMESSTSYLERMCGIFTVYVALTQINLNALFGSNGLQEVSYGIPFAWRYISRFLNRVVPLTLISRGENTVEGGMAQTACSIAAVFCEFGGKEFRNNYGQQANKIFALIFSREWIGTSGGGSAFVRLRLIRDLWLENSKFWIDYNFEP